MTWSWNCCSGAVLVYQYHLLCCWLERRRRRDRWDHLSEMVVFLFTWECKTSIQSDKTQFIKKSLESRAKKNEWKKNLHMPSSKGLLTAAWASSFLIPRWSLDLIICFLPRGGLRVHHCQCLKGNWCGITFHLPFLRGELLSDAIGGASMARGPTFLLTSRFRTDPIFFFMPKKVSFPYRTTIATTSSEDQSFSETNPSITWVHFGQNNTPPDDITPSLPTWQNFF